MTIYYKHHIIPKHMGGTDDPSNIVKLTVEEHAKAHQKLFEEHGKWQDYLAWQGLSGIIPTQEVVHIMLSNAGKTSKGRKLGPQSREHVESRIRKGWNHTEESKQKMRKASIGNTHNCGRKQSKETIEKRMATIAKKRMSN